MGDLSFKPIIIVVVFIFAAIALYKALGGKTE